MSNPLINAKLWKDGVGGLVEGGGLMCIKRKILAKFMCWFRGKKSTRPFEIFNQINHHGVCNFFFWSTSKLYFTKKTFFSKNNTLQESWKTLTCCWVLVIGSPNPEGCFEVNAEHGLDAIT